MACANHLWWHGVLALPWFTGLVRCHLTGLRLVFWLHSWEVGTAPFFEELEDCLPGSWLQAGGMPWQWLIIEYDR